MFLDDVAVDFPDIAARHRASLVSVAGRGACRRNPQAERVHRSLRLVAEVFPRESRAVANTLLKDRVLFGSDFPALTPDRWIADFDTLNIKPEVRPLIMKDNAVRLLGLGTS